MDGREGFLEEVTIQLRYEGWAGGRKVAGGVSGGDGVCGGSLYRGSCQCGASWQEDTRKGVQSMGEGSPGYIICRAPCKMKMWVPCSKMLKNCKAVRIGNLLL